MLDHQLLKNNRTPGIEKKNSKEIYSIIISFKVNIPTSRIYFEKIFHFYDFQWKDIYTLPHKVSINAYFRSFQYKILNNILYLNKNPYTFALSNTQLCSFCKMEEEIISHLFYYCTHVQDIWNQVQIYFTDCFHFSQLTPQTAIFGFHNIDNDTFLIQNHILLLFKLYIYNARKHGFLSFNNFLNEISKIENLEKRVAPNNWNKFERFIKKWHRTENKVP